MTRVANMAMAISKGKYSYYVGIGTIIPWVIIFLFYFIKGIGAMTDAVLLIYGFIIITIFQIVGLVLGAVGSSRKSS